MTKFRSVFAAFTAAASLALAACASAPAAAPASDVRQIASTTSFGMCVGYCTTRLEISEGQAVLVREARGGRGAPQNLPEQRFTTTLSASEWQEIQRLAANADLSALPDRIGCPDCADGGAETLTINGGRTLTFDFRAPIAEAGPLLDRIRALRDRLTPEGG
jgi:hypothetical protein